VSSEMSGTKFIASMLEMVSAEERVVGFAMVLR